MKDTPHIGLARKYRPQQFKDIVGQEAVATTLKNAIGEEKPAHAYLFFGPRGIGKTTTARVLAKSLNCKKGPTPTPCGECSSCKEIAAGGAIDVMEIDAASHTGIDNIREAIIETVSLAPSRDRFKVFIIDEVHMLSKSSFNALLKTLEEPPSHVVFILATTELAKIPPTIISRCQRFRFRPLPQDVIAEHLAYLAKAEKFAAEKDALAILARAADGSMRDAISLLDQTSAFSDGAVTRDKVGELMGMLPEEAQLGLVGAVLEKDAVKLTEWLERAAAEGFETTQLLRDLRERLQEMYLYRLGARSSAAKAWQALAGDHPPETFSFLLKRVNRTLFDLRSADSPQQAFELGIYGMLESAYDLRRLVQRLELLEQRLSAGAPAAPPPVRSAASSAAVPQRPAPDEPAPVRSRPPEVKNIWPAILDRFRDASPTLAESLKGSRLVPGDGDDWKLLFASAFNLDLAQSHRADIERAIHEVTGRNIHLRMETDSEAKTAPKKAKPGAAKDKPDEDGPSDPAVKKVLGAFEGARVKQVRKKTG
ncbi:MAG: DNA polymerase III subunit gamma/tau [Elusimicrobiota bacterium]